MDLRRERKRSLKLREMEEAQEEDRRERENSTKKSSYGHYTVRNTHNIVYVAAAVSYSTRRLGILTKSDVQSQELRVSFAYYAARGMSLLETSSFFWYRVNKFSIVDIQ